MSLNIINHIIRKKNFTGHFLNDIINNQYVIAVSDGIPARYNKRNKLLKTKTIQNIISSNNRGFTLKSVYKPHPRDDSGGTPPYFAALIEFSRSVRAALRSSSEASLYLPLLMSVPNASVRFQ